MKHQKSDADKTTTTSPPSAASKTTSGDSKRDYSFIDSSTDRSNDDTQPLIHGGRAAAHSSDLDVSKVTASGGNRSSSNSSSDVAAAHSDKCADKAARAQKTNTNSGASHAYDEAESAEAATNSLKIQTSAADRHQPLDFRAPPSAQANSKSDIPLEALNANEQTKFQIPILHIETPSPSSYINDLPTPLAHRSLAINSHKNAASGTVQNQLEVNREPETRGSNQMLALGVAPKKPDYLAIPMDKHDGQRLRPEGKSASPAPEIGDAVAANNSGTRHHGERSIRDSVIHSVREVLHRRMSWSEAAFYTQKSGMTHVMYIAGLIFYTFLGGVLFRMLDKQAGDEAVVIYRNRCVGVQLELMQNLSNHCENATFKECRPLIEEALRQVDRCHKECRNNCTKKPSLPMSDLQNAVMFASTIYTTIGYGSVYPTTSACKIAVILYTCFGIPYFLALLLDIGRFLKLCFQKAWNKFLGKMKGKSFSMDQLNEVSRLHRHWIPFFIGSLTLFAYICALSAVLIVSPGWNVDYFNTFYFLFQSITLVGFGDIFPTNAHNVLWYSLPMLLGILLISMCFFIMQEDIMEKAHVATHRMKSGASRFSKRWSFQRHISSDYEQQALTGGRMTQSQPLHGSGSESELTQKRQLFRRGWQGTPLNGPVSDPTARRNASQEKLANTVGHHRYALNDNLNEPVQLLASPRKLSAPAQTKLSTTDSTQHADSLSQQIADMSSSETGSTEQTAALKAEDKRIKLLKTAHQSLERRSSRETAV